MTADKSPSTLAAKDEDEPNGVELAIGLLGDFCRLGDMRRVSAAIDVLSNYRAALEQQPDAANKDFMEKVEKAIAELSATRLELAADLGNINAPAVSRTKHEILEYTIAEIEGVLAILDALKPTTTDRRKGT